MQNALISVLKSDNSKFKEVETVFNLDALFESISAYIQKVLRLRGEMNMITERVSRLKVSFI